MVKPDASKGCYRCWIGKTTKGGSWVSGLFSLFVVVVVLGWFCFGFFCLFLLLFIPSMIYGAIQNLGQFWRYDFFQILSKGISAQIVFSDPWKWWGSCWVTGMEMEKGLSYPCCEKLHSSTCSWCAALAILHSGVIMGGLCFALAQGHCLLHFWMWPLHKTSKCTCEGRNT